MKRYIIHLVIVLVLTHAAIFGAWLAGAQPGAYAFVLAWFFSFMLVTGVTLWGDK
jgi:hypothetical protein